jgi:peptidoglycan biosynthesis protein MviN/MurJ (putative lipid II flippase)
VSLGLSVGAGSSIDTDIVPSSSVEVIAYLPRALWVGLLSPFPSMWLERISATRLVGAVETAIWYLIVLGGVITIARAGSLKLFAGVVFTFSILTVIAFIHPNVGTLYRMRYGLWMFVLLLGACGWAYVIQKVVSSSGSERATADTLLVGTMKSRNTPLPGMNRVAASGTAVLVITFVCYLGLLIRDLLLVNQLGFGGNLDALFTALMIPMFFVSFLAMPMADALTVPFVSAQSKVIHYNASLLRHLLGFAILLLGAAMTLVILTAPILTRLMLGGEGAVSNEETTLLIRWFAPILLLSAWTVTGNAALNSLNRQRQAAFGQWFVPVVTIVALGFVSTGQSVQATIAGMLLGTLLNVFWVAYHLKSVGINFLPSLPSFDLLTPVLFVYRRLLLAVFLPAILVPLNYFFAASINAGSVSAWAFASKIVVLFSGLASVGATAVVLPHLARLLVHGGRVYVRQDANLLLVLASWLGGLLSVGAFLFADPLFAAILSTNLSQEQLVELAYIVKVGILQLPMAIAGALVTKIAIVSGSSRVVMHAALFGFITNLLLNLLLVPQLGMMGVAVGALAGTVISTVSLILSAHNPIGLRFKDVLILFSSWLVWAGVCVAMSSRSVAALVSVLFAVAAMTWTQYNLLHSGRQIIQKPV